MAITDDPRIKEFEHQVRSKISEQVDFMAKGKCSSFDEYKRRVGVISGLDMSLEILTDVLKSYGKDGDDE